MDESCLLFNGTAASYFAKGQILRCRQSLQASPGTDAVSHFLSKHNLLLCSDELSDQVEGLLEYFHTLCNIPLTWDVFALQCSAVYNYAVLLLRQDRGSAVSLFKRLVSNSLLLMGDSYDPQDRDLDSCLTAFAKVGGFLMNEQQALCNLFLTTTYAICAHLFLEGSVKPAHKFLVNISHIRASHEPPCGKATHWCWIHCLKSTLPPDHIHKLLMSVHAYISDNTAKTKELLSNCRFDSSINCFIIYLQAYVGYEVCADSCLKHIQNNWNVIPLQKSPVKTLFKTLIGCCIAKIGKPHAAVQWFSMALKDVRFNPIAMWNISCVYSKLNNNDAETQVLKILFDKLYGGTCLSSRVVNGLKKHLFLSYPTYFIAPFILLYSAAHSLLTLQQYEVAAECFYKLKSILKKQQHFPETSWCSLRVPSMRQLYFTATYSAYKAGKLQDCLSFSTVALQAIATETQKHANMKNNSESKIDFDLKSADFYTDSQIENNNIIITLLYLMRSSSSIHLKHFDLALSDLEEALQLLSKACNCDCMKQNKTLLSPESAKIPRVSSNCNRFQESCVTCMYKSKVYTNIAILRIQQNLLDDAAVYLKAALAMWAGNKDAAYNCCLLYLKTGKLDQARHVWTGYKNIFSENNAYCFSVRADHVEALESVL